MAYPTINEQIERLQDISAKTGGYLQQLQAVQAKAEEEMAVGDISMDTCEKGAAIFKKIHTATRSLDIKAYGLHYFMQEQLPEGMNEGDKDC